MNDSREPSRVSQGVPTGGQFAASARAESGVTLTTATPGPPADRETFDEWTEHRRFACETHDGPGECDAECVELLNLADGPRLGLDYDPTGASYGPERAYDTYVLDDAARASVCVTHVPPGEVLPEQATEGTWVYVDGRPQQVASVTISRWVSTLEFVEPHVPVHTFDRSSSLDLVDPDHIPVR